MNAENQDGAASSAGGTRRLSAAERKRTYRQSLSVSSLESEREKNTQLRQLARKKSKLDQTCKAREIDCRVDPFTLGPLDQLCRHCGAKHFDGERNTRGEFVGCCMGGKVSLDDMNDYPAFLHQLLTANNKASKHFREHIRSYNSSFAFASFGYKSLNQPGKGPKTFVVHGQVYHRTSSKLSGNDDDPKYSELYILDPAFALNQRMSNPHNAFARSEVFINIDEFLRRNNPFAIAYKMMHSVLNQQKNGENHEEIRMWIIKDRSKDARRYNLPVANEVAAVFKNSDGEPPFDRDICIHSKDGGGLINIHITSPNCDPMVYPILFPRGDAGWQVGLTRQGDTKRTRISQQEFYAYRLQIREKFNPLLHSGKLTQQFIVDSDLKVEANRLQWYKLNQQTLRVEMYLGLTDFVNRKAEKEGLKAGKICILPSSFSGSKRNMQQCYQDAMALVSKFGKPDLFITFTANPKWKEIQDNLLPGETAIDRPDLVAVVFKLKLKEFLDDILKKEVFGHVLAYVYVIEFQKRGLPHCHSLFILEKSKKFKEPADIDSAVSAEIPDKLTNPALYDIVTSTMIHGPCGPTHKNAPCMELATNGDHVCSKRFPKSLNEETASNIDGYPQYKRSNNGRSVTVKGVPLDNGWVVPYNPYLSQKYQAHINVEVCTSIKSVKYLYKYVYKGHDAAVVVIGEARAADGTATVSYDEITEYMDSRYVGGPESMWRLREYEMHDILPHIIRLAVHLPDMQSVVFKEGNEQQALENAARKGTTLTAWFKLNQLITNAKQYLYSEIPYYYVYHKQIGEWKPRERGGDRILPRMYSVSPNDMERFSLRTLLLHVRGATSFESLRTVDGYVHDTFCKAAIALNLLEDDSVWMKTMDEAVVFQMPSQFRQLFAGILLFGHPSDPLQLWNNYKDSLSEDFRRRTSEDVAYDMALHDIEQSLLGKPLSNFNLPKPRVIYDDNADVEFDVQFEEAESRRLHSQLNDDQLKAYNIIMKSVSESSQHKYFFVSGPGGSGKTFLYQALISAVRSLNKNVVSIAPTGLAATLLKGGKTVHSAFGLPLHIDETSSTNIRQGSKDGKFFQKAGLLIWDEISMCNFKLFDCVDRSLQQLKNSMKPFGGLTVVVGGDFRQQLPVVKHGSRVDVVEACVKQSRRWRLFKQLNLRTNMRVNVDEIEFSKWLINVGDGKNPTGEPSELVEIKNNLESNDIIKSVYGDDINTLTVEQMASRAILCPKNEDVLSINEDILRKLNGEKKVYLSVDSISDVPQEEADNFQVEFLNSLTPMGLPPHKLTLKPGCSVMLLRNMNPRKGLCNGTRLIVRNMAEHFLDCEIYTGENKGQRVFLPRFKLNSADADLPFNLNRRQFPIRLAYSMTITKSQGQTFDRIGVHLPQPVFTHGQLYTAFSRVRSEAGLSVQVVEGSRQGRSFLPEETIFTPNCVYREVL